MKIQNFILVWIGIFLLINFLVESIRSDPKDLERSIEQCIMILPKVSPPVVVGSVNLYDPERDEVITYCTVAVPLDLMLDKWLREKTNPPSRDG